MSWDEQSASRSQRIHWAETHVRHCTTWLRCVSVSSSSESLVCVRYQASSNNGDSTAAAALSVSPSRLLASPRLPSVVGSINSPAQVLSWPPPLSAIALLLHTTGRSCHTCSLLLVSNFLPVSTTSSTRSTTLSTLTLHPSSLPKSSSTPSHHHVLHQDRQAHLRLPRLLHLRRARQAHVLRTQRQGTVKTRGRAALQPQRPQWTLAEDQHQAAQHRAQPQSQQQPQVDPQDDAQQEAEQPQEAASGGRPVMMARKVEQHDPGQLLLEPANSSVFSPVYFSPPLCISFAYLSFWFFSFYFFLNSLCTFLFFSILSCPLPLLYCRAFLFFFCTAPSLFNYYWPSLFLSLAIGPFAILLFSEIIKNVLFYPIWLFTFGASLSLQPFDACFQTKWPSLWFQCIGTKHRKTATVCAFLVANDIFSHGQLDLFLLLAVCTIYKSWTLLSILHLQQYNSHLASSCPRNDFGYVRTMYFRPSSYARRKRKNGTPEKEKKENIVKTRANFLQLKLNLTG